MRLSNRSWWFGALLLSGAVAEAQESSVPMQTLADNTPRFVAFTDARIVVGPRRVIERGTLVIRDGRVVALDTRADAAPAGALEIDLDGRSVYPGFIDLHAAWGFDAQSRCRTQAPPAGGGGGGGRFGGMGGGAPAAPTASGATHWNARMCPERDVSQALVLDGEKAKGMRKAGFAAVLSTPMQGVLRGQGAVLSLADNPSPQQNLLKPRVSQHVAFEQVFSFGGEYPGSKMGAIALLRQSLLDASWQQSRRDYIAKGKAAERPEANAALDALGAVVTGQQPLVFDLEDELEAARALKIAKEFELKPPILVGTGAEYRALADLRGQQGVVVVPLNYPKTPAADDAEAALDLSLVELEHWRYAPYNARLLHEAGVNVAFTATGLEQPGEEFLPAVRKAVRYGLPPEQALAALTEVPAQALGMSQSLGSLEVGRMANLLIAEGDLLREDSASLMEAWVEGHREVLKALDQPEITGRWTLDWQGQTGPAEWVVSGKPGDLKFKAGETEFTGKLNEHRLLLYPPAKLLGGSGEGKLALEAALVEGRLDGRWVRDDGQVLSWLATRAGDAPAEAKPEAKEDAEAKPEVAKAPPALPALPARWRFPAGEYGRESLPEQSKALLFRDATVWMTGAGEPAAETDVLVESGKIKAVGVDLKAPAGAIEIDARGKHLTPGLIDAHSHIAVSGNVNEPSHAITSEVRLGDVIDATDIDIYRELAGGTTTSHVLHGSANPIGGQSQLIKHRWGAGAEALKFEGWTPTIKFALGENVKQSNWGEQFRTRYPQTRMGVEQILRDAFLQARAYAEARAEKGGVPLRRDLRLEALAEILAHDRLVHIHSYRQDEILMFARLSQELGFPVAAFQHVLEGYKVADVLNEIDAGASTFADWWSFKVEVVDGIPDNAAMMHRQGVLTSLNSDSPDLGRRLNTEAAKTVKYSGLSDTEALALVTINPARQLRVDDRVGSIEAGKDADLVLWTQHPLSSYARPQSVWIDGRRYFDVDEDAAEQARVESARAELLAIAREEKLKAPAGGPPRGPMGGPPRLYTQLSWFANGWPTELTALRGSYHDSEPVHYCKGH